MSNHGKKYIKAKEDVAKKQPASIDDVFKVIKDSAFAKFDESVDININLGIDASKGDQTVRGSVILPHGTGRKKRIIVFAKGDYADQALKAGADLVGTDDLIEKISGGWMDFDYAIATPDLMGLVGKVAKQLGPRGLLPNKKLGTVTFDVADVVEELKKGRMFFKADKGGIVHFSIGKVSFNVNQLHDNLGAVVKAVVSAKPASAKGKYLKKITVSSTMGVGLSVNPDEVLRSF